MARLLPALRPFARSLTPSLRRLTTSTPPPPAPPAPRPYLAYTSLLSLGLLSGYVLALLPRPQLISLLFPSPTPHSPPAASEEGLAWTAAVERGLQDLELVKGLRGETVEREVVEVETSLSGLGRTESVRKWTESRPYAASVPGPHSLSAHTLRGTFSS